MKLRRQLLTDVRQYGDRWGFDDYFTTGKRIQVRRQTKKLADDVYTDLAVLIANGRKDLANITHADLAEFRNWQTRMRSSCTVTEAISALLAEKKAKRNTGRKWLEKLSDYLNRIKEEFGDEPIVAVKADRLERFLFCLNLSPRSRNNMRAVLVD